VVGDPLFSCLCVLTPCSCFSFQSTRYEAEKTVYKGPWKIPSNKRKTKDPAAPKRPMSSFLAYSNSRRAALKREHPKSTNADLSRMLSKSWKELPPTERAVYMAEERKLREKYKTDMSEWRNKVAEEKKVEREEREAAAMEASETGQPPQVMEQDGMAANLGSMNKKWTRSLPNRQQEEMQQLQQQAQQTQQKMQQNHVQDAQQQQLHDMASSGAFANPYFQAAAFGGNTSLGLNSAAASANPYRANAFANQNYMQGMQGAGQPALSLFGKSRLLTAVPRNS
jgi:HMG (high mobility group) box